MLGHCDRPTVRVTKLNPKFAFGNQSLRWKSCNLHLESHSQNANCSLREYKTQWKWPKIVNPFMAQVWLNEIHMTALILTSMLGAVGYSILYLILGGGFGGAILIFIIAKMLRK